MSHSKALPHVIVVLQGGVVQNVLGADYIVWDWDDINYDPAALPDMMPFMRVHAATVTEAADKLWRSFSLDQQAAFLPSIGNSAPFPRSRPMERRRPHHRHQPPIIPPTPNFCAP